MTDKESRARLRAVALDLPSGGRLPEHLHAWDQLAYAVRGVMSVVTAQGTWVVPTQRAVWIPAGVEHRVEAHGPLSLRTLYLPPGLAERLPRHGCVVGVPALLRELVLELIRTSTQDPERRCRLEALTLDLLEELPQEPLTLPLPVDPRARKLAALLGQDPADPRSLPDLAREVGASARTLQRCFLRETGMSFREWRQQLRLHHALVLLAEGRPVTGVAAEVGYESASAFVSMFRLALGKTPGRYFRKPGRPAGR